MYEVVSFGEGRIERQFWENGKIKSYIKYDESGRKVEECNFDREGRLRSGIDGWAAMRWKYKGSQLAEEAYYGEDGRMTERKMYNELGDLIGKEYAAGVETYPSEEFEPLPIVAGETVIYDR